MPERNLTIAQHNRLEALEPETKVIGWHGNGPLLRKPNGGYAYISTKGRVNHLKNKPLCKST